MTIFFSYSSPKIPKEDIFGAKILDFYFCNNTISRKLISNMKKLFFKSQLQNPKIRHFWFQTLRFLFFYQPLQQDKLEDKDFSYDNSIFKLQPENKEIRDFCNQIQTFFVFSLNSAIRNIQDGDLKYEKIVFKFLPKNTQIRHFWFQVKALCFSLKLFHKLKGADFKYDNILFVFQPKKYPKKTFLVPNLWIFIFALNFATTKF